MLKSKAKAYGRDPPGESPCLTPLDDVLRVSFELVTNPAAMHELLRTMRAQHGMDWLELQFNDGAGGMACWQSGEQPALVRTDNGRRRHRTTTDDGMTLLLRWLGGPVRTHSALAIAVQAIAMALAIQREVPMREACPASEFDELIMRSLGHEREAGGEPKAFGSRLSRAEHAVYGLLLGGADTATIMARRGVSRETVRTQVRQLLAKLGCRNRRELLVKALEDRMESLS